MQLWVISAACLLWRSRQFIRASLQQHFRSLSNLLEAPYRHHVLSIGNHGPVVNVGPDLTLVAVSCHLRKSITKNIWYRPCMMMMVHLLAVPSVWFTAHDTGYVRPVILALVFAISPNLTVLILVLRQLLLVVFDFVFQMTVFDAKRWLSTLKLTNEFLIMKLLKLDRLDHFFQQLSRKSQVLLDLSNLLSVPYVKGLKLLLAADKASVLVLSSVERNLYIFSK